MSHTPQAVAKQFVREATIGLVVVALLLVMVVHGLTRRFGMMEPVKEPGNIEAARVFSRLPKPPGTPDQNAESPAIAASSQSVPALASGSGGPAGTQRLPAGSGMPTGVRLANSDEVLPSGSSQNPRSAATIPVVSPNGSEMPEPNQRLSVGSLPTTRATSRGNDNPATETARESPATPFRPLPERLSERNRPAGSPAENLGGVLAEGSGSSSAGRLRGPAADPRWTIQLNDSSWSYCDRNYGDPQWFRALEAWMAKGGRSFDDLHAGERLTPPAIDELRLAAPSVAPNLGSPNATSSSSIANRGANESTRPASTSGPAGDQATYVASGSESLFDIAGRLYGQAGRYVEIVQLEQNQPIREIDPLLPLPVGTRLVLPVIR